MVQLKPETKQRVMNVVNVAKLTVHFGFIPLILYLGFKKGNDPGMPELSLASLLWA